MRPSVMLTSSEISSCFWKTNVTRVTRVTLPPTPSRRESHLSVELLDQSHVPRFGVDLEILPGALFESQTVSHRVPFRVGAVQDVDPGPWPAETGGDLSQNCTKRGEYRWCSIIRRRKILLCVTIREELKRLADDSPTGVSSEMLNRAMFPSVLLGPLS